jgi:hypothetical protein
VLPWIVAIPLQTGSLIKPFQTWTSNIFVSTSNFIIPVIIYFECVQFRKAYNQDRSILTAKQLEILKAIHSKSSSLVKQLGKRKNQLETETARPSEVTNSNVDGITMVIPERFTPLSEAHLDQMVEDHELNNVLKDDVPDPDQEDVLAGRIDPLNPSFATRLNTTISNAMGTRRRIPHVKDLFAEGTPGPSDFQLNVIPPPTPPKDKNLSVVPPPRTSASTINEKIDLSVVRASTSSEKLDLSVSAPRGLLGIPSLDFDRKSFRNSSSSSMDGHMGRVQTLMTHPNFRTPAFRSVPIWFPIRGIDMAWIVLILTSLVTVGNIVINLLPK